jgi:diketogulonate reductase-like aldo/keto reductase
MLREVRLRGGVMPSLGFGTYRTAGEPCYNAVRHALAVGYKLVDTAAVYRNEEIVGRAIQDSGVPRADLFITTKISAGDHGAAKAYAAAKAALARLKVDYVDLLLLHWPGAYGHAVDDPRVPALRLESWQALQGRRRGQVYVCE